jgi:predicted transcriptional regulator
MRTITIELHDDVANALEQKARETNISVSELAERGIAEFVTDLKADVNRIIREVIRDNAELYRRLA